MAALPITIPTVGRTPVLFLKNLRWCIWHTTAERWFVWGVRSVDDIVLRDSGSGRLYALGDAQNITAVIDTSGVVQARYGYTGFGTVRYMNASFGAGSTNDWETLFGGYRYDVETGFYQVRYRYYHSSLGRWVSRDPIGENDGVNLQWYVRNSPVNWCDPSGKMTDTGVKLCREYGPLVYFHEWLEYDGEAAGYYPSGEGLFGGGVCSFGKIVNPDGASNNKKRCQKVSVSKCVDVSIFKRCIERRMAPHEKGVYNFALNNCWNWTGLTLIACISEAYISSLACQFCFMPLSLGDSTIEEGMRSPARKRYDPYRPVSPIKR